MRKRVILSWAIFGLLMIFIAAWAPARIFVIEGRRHFAAGQYQQAVAYFQHAIRFSPTFARAHVKTVSTFRCVNSSTDKSFW